VKLLRPVWVALRAAVVATAVFWLTLSIVKSNGWEAPLDATEPLIFLVIFFLGFLLVPKR
jgi:hypothetical protein